jgi:hypothetical protein
MQLKAAVLMCSWLLATGCGEDFLEDSGPSDSADDDEPADEDSDEQLPAGSRSGVDNQHTAADLNNAEVQSLCGWAASSYQALLSADPQQTCTLFAGGFGGSPAECSLIVEECVDEIETVGLPPADPTTCPADLVDCSATVGEIEACLAEQYAALEVLLDAVSCEGGLPADVESKYAQIPPACALVQAKCPAMFEDAPEERWFVCDPGTIDEQEIPMSSVCDSVTDCEDGGDEVGCDAALSRFVCDDGTVIAESGVCDGDFDCATGEDELLCP